MDEGKRIRYCLCQHFIYINRDTGEVKEAIVGWDAVAQYDAEQLVEKIRQAKLAIERGELPEPTVESSYICSKLCPYRLYCEPGRKFVASGIEKEQKRRPPWVYRKAKEEARQKREEMERLGIVQPQLPGWKELIEAFSDEGKNESFGTPLKRSSREKSSRREGPLCGDCGSPTYWDPKAARGGRWVCPQCGND